MTSRIPALSLVAAANGSLRTGSKTAASTKCQLDAAAREDLLSRDLIGTWDAIYTFTPAGRAALETAV